MIKFNIDLLKYEYYNITEMTMFGTFTYVDNEGNVKKIHSNKMIAKMFKKNAGCLKLASPKKTCILFYDNFPILLDTPIAKFFDNAKRDEFYLTWKSTIEIGIENLKKDILSRIESEDIFFDGKFLFFLPRNKELPENGFPYTNITSVTTDNFFLLNCDCFNLTRIKAPQELKNSKRFVYSYHVKHPVTQQYVTALSPTFKILSKEKNSQMIENLDLIDKNYYVNLNFTLEAAKYVGQSLGYESISFLELEALLVRLNTVNLYSIPEHIRNLTPVDQSFKECLAWFLAACLKETNIKFLNDYRFILSSFLSSWLIKKDYLNKTFKNSEDSNAEVKLIDVAKIRTQADSMSSFDIVKAGATSRVKLKVTKEEKTES